MTGDLLVTTTKKRANHKKYPDGGGVAQLLVLIGIQAPRGLLLEFIFPATVAIGAARALDDFALMSNDAAGVDGSCTESLEAEASPKAFFVTVLHGIHRHFHHA